jgi:hypothetical protein
MGLISDLFAGWRGDPNVAIGGNVYALTTLTLIKPGFSDRLRADIRALGTPGPFAAVGGTHFARLVVLDRLPFEGPVQDAPDVRGEFLLFSAVVDGRECREYLVRLHRTIPREVERIWGRCVGVPAADDSEGFADWMIAHLLRTRAFFRDYDGTVGEVSAALALRERVRQFALDNQYGTAPELRASFDDEFGNGRA